MTAASTSAITMNDAAEPKGQFRAAENWFCTRLPIIISLAPPSRSEVRNDPSAGMKTSRQPATTPGMDSGRVTRRKRSAGLAPSTSAASSNEKSSFSSEA